MGCSSSTYAARRREARDNLLMAKHRQAVQANKHRRPDPIYKVGDQVLVNTRNVRHEYKSSSSFKNSAKFIPRYDGPYTIVKAFPNQSLYELDVLLAPMTPLDAMSPSSSLTWSLNVIIPRPPSNPKSQLHLAPRSSRSLTSAPGRTLRRSESG